MASHKEKCIQMLALELKTNKHSRDSGMFKEKMKRFSVYWKILFTSVGIETFYLSFSCCHILCFKLKAVIISVFCGTLLQDSFCFV